MKEEEKCIYVSATGRWKVNIIQNEKGEKLKNLLGMNNFENERPFAHFLLANSSDGTTVCYVFVSNIL